MPTQQAPERMQPTLAPDCHLEPFNPLSPEFRADPYAIYRRFRTHDPVHCAVAATEDRSGFWYLFRHADVAATLRDPRFGRELNRVAPSNVAVMPETKQPFYEMAGKWMLYRDPPNHTRLRSLVSKAFTPATVERLRLRIAAHAEQLLDVVEANGTMDLIGDFAFPLPLFGLGEMLGVRAHDLRQFRDWSNALSAGIDQNRTPEVYEQASQATLALSAYFQEILDERRRYPQDDLMSRLIAAEEQDGHLSEDEIIATCILLLGAGQETTVDLIGNSVLALLRHPQQLELLKNHPTLIAPAVEELLRYDSPVQMTARVALEDVEIGGHLIHRGAKVTMVLGSANHDPSVFPDPDRLDMTRNARAHFGFGVGIHYCLGAPLARAGGCIALSALLRRFPNLRLKTQSPEWREGPVFRGLKRLPVSF
jgi:cytochrome P450